MCNLETKLIQKEIKMNSQEIIEEIQSYEPLVPTHILEQALAEPLSILCEPINHVLPSFSVGADGPILAGFFLITDNFLSESRVHPTEINYDISRRNTICNIRYKKSKVNIMGENNVVKNSHTVHEYEMVHTNGMLRTQINLVDKDNLVPKWKALVEQIFPTNSLVAG